MSVHNTTFDPLTGMKHAANLLRVMRTSIGTNESLCPFYLFFLEIYGGVNHNHKHVRNQIALFSLFLIGNMDDLNMTRGYPSIYLLNTSERSMDLMSIVISGLALKSNVRVCDEFLMYEVIGDA